MGVKESVSLDFSKSSEADPLSYIWIDLWWFIGKRLYKFHKIK